jgi:excisionase family DNA binding protein
MTAYRLQSAGVLLMGDHVDAVREAVRIARLARTRNGLPEAPILAELASILQACPQRDLPEQSTPDHEAMTTREVAELLGVSPRHVRRLAPGLDGFTKGGRLLFPAAAVRQHLDGKDLT